jgi:hypothetical protein
MRINRRSWCSKEVARSKCPGSSRVAESNLALRRKPARVSALPSTLRAPSSFRGLGSATVPTLTSRHCARRLTEDCSHLFPKRCLRAITHCTQDRRFPRQQLRARPVCTNARGKGAHVAGHLNSAGECTSSFFLTSLCWNRALSRHIKSLGAL